MTKALSLSALFLASTLAGCVVGDEGSPSDPGSGSNPGSGSGSNPGSGSDPGTGGGLAGAITADTTWTGTVVVSGTVTINAGVTVTVAAGADVQMAAGAGITVKGTFDVQGAKGNVAKIGPTTATGHFGGVTNEGVFKMSYGKQFGGPIYTADGSTTTIVDSVMYGASGDYIVMNGGALDVQYSTLGLLTGDTTHCNMHLNKATTIKFTHNIDQGAPFGLMYYATAADFTHNNWITTTPNVDVEPGNKGPADFTGSYFSRGTMPSGTMGMTYNTLSTTALVDVGPRQP